MPRPIEYSWILPGRRNLFNIKRRKKQTAEELISLHSKVSSLSLELAEKEKLLNQLNLADIYFNVFFEESDEAYCICKPDGLILKINNSAAALFGLSQTDMIDTSISAYKLKSRTGKTNGKSIIKNELKNKFPSCHEFIYKQDDGSEAIIEFQFRPYHSESGFFQFIRLRDTSMRQIINGNEKKQKEFLERLVKERTSNLMKTNSKLQREIRDRSEERSCRERV